MLQIQEREYNIIRTARHNTRGESVVKSECERRSRVSKEDPDILGCATREEQFDLIETARTEIPVDRKSVVGTRIF